MTSAALIQANALALPLADRSVDLIVTSPPYFAARAYADNEDQYEGQLGNEPTPAEFVSALHLVTRELVRVLKPTGSLFVNLGDKYAGSAGTSGATTSFNSRAKAAREHGYRPDFEHIRAKSLVGVPWRYALGCVDDLGLILRAEIVWAKSNGLPDSARDRVARKHEQWFHFTREPTYHVNPEEKALLPGSVWTLPTEGVRLPPYMDVDHFAPFPREWPRRLILGWCPPGGVVLDPFVGSGTTVLVARMLGRYGIGVDLSADYLKLARWRVFRSGHGHKVEQRTHRERQGVLPW